MMVLGLVLLVVLMVVGLVVLGQASRRERPGGWLRERLAACGDSPNCVSSRDRRESHRVEPLPASGDPEEAFRRAVEAVKAVPGTRLVVEESGYLHAEWATPLFRFVDDLELQLDGDVIQVRSASRIGKSDLGANRRRVERLRELLAGG